MDNSPSTLTGTSIIAGQQAATSNLFFEAYDPRLGVKLSPKFYEAQAEQIELALEKADQAFNEAGPLSVEKRFALLNSLAMNLEKIRSILVERYVQETGYPEPRANLELDRTIFQLKSFANAVTQEKCFDPRIDPADVSNLALFPDVRSRLVPLGPVAVFGASNFPLAYSVAGGDSASAFAAGCPVIVKAHPLHPGTSELVGWKIVESLQQNQIDPGYFSLLQGTSYSVGQKLVSDSKIKAVGFTGSRKGGEALMEAAAKRPYPIPVFAEMGSVNPMFILANAVQTNLQLISQLLQQSIHLGSGQFCTKPGILIIPETTAGDKLVRELSEFVKQAPPLCMLAKALLSNFNDGVKRLQNLSGVVEIAQSKPSDSVSSQALARLFSTTADLFISTQKENPEAFSEVFGPVSVIVRTNSEQQILALARSFTGELTATIHATISEAELASRLIAVLENRVGRIIWNGVPTGLRVCNAMTHGGPFPASSRPDSTSVGERAILRWMRPVTYQNFPAELLPKELT